VELLPTSAALELFEGHIGPEESLAPKLQALEIPTPDFLLGDLEGTDAVREVRVRTNQRVFRVIVLRIYQSRCCLTGLDIPEVNRASHIVPWATFREARMDPRNGLCLSATDDAAFDRHLFTLDRYRLVLSKALALPLRYRPSQVYVEQHRAACRV
jgi:putative restriction endonuclease